MYALIASRTRNRAATARYFPSTIAVAVTGDVASNSIVWARSSSETSRIVRTGTRRRSTKVVS